METCEVAVRFEKRFLNQVGCSSLGLDVGSDSFIGDAQQISAASLEELAQRVARPGAGRGQMVRGVSWGWCHAPIPLSTKSGKLGH
jgi:hypothetical protein